MKCKKCGTKKKRVPLDTGGSFLHDWLKDAPWAHKVHYSFCPKCKPEKG